MNLFSKVTLLVTLLTVPFAGFAMEDTTQGNSSIYRNIALGGCLAIGAAVVGYIYFISPKKSSTNEDKSKAVKVTPQGATIALSSTESTIHKKKRNSQAVQQPAQQVAPVISSDAKAEEPVESTSLLGGVLGMFSSAKGDAAKVEKLFPADKSKLNNFAREDQEQLFEARVIKARIDVTWADYQAWLKTQSKIK